MVCSTDSSVIPSRATYSELVSTLSSDRFHGALAQAHFSPWRSPGSLLAALPRALRGLIAESMPGSHPHRLGVPTTVAIQTGLPGVIILSRPTRSAVPSSQSVQVSTFDLCSPLNPLPSPTMADSVPPSPALLTPMETCDRAPSPTPLGGSLLQRPGRPLTFADFPTPNRPHQGCRIIGGSPLSRPPRRI